MTVIHIFIAALAFGFIVFFHELFHYLAARAVGVQPKEFAVGFGKSIVVYQKKKVYFFPSKHRLPYDLDVISYHLKIFPLGGYVLFERPKEDENGQPYFEGEYEKIHPLKRMFISVAGPLGNFILAIIFLFLLLSPNISLTNSGTITDVYSGSLAESIGLKVNDKIVQINEHPIHNTGDIPKYINSSDELCLSWENNFGAHSECINTQGDKLGFSYSMDVWEGIKHSFKSFTEIVQSYMRSFINIVLNLEFKQLNGPLGTLDAIQQSVPVWENFVSILVVVNIALGTINLILPLTVTDGGKIIIDFICLIRNKKSINTNLLDICSFGILMGLFILTFFLDITRIFQ